MWPTKPDPFHVETYGKWKALFQPLNLVCIHVLNVIWYSFGIIILDFMIMEYRPRKATFSCLSTWGPLSQFLFLSERDVCGKWFLPGMTSSEAFHSTYILFLFFFFFPCQFNIRVTGIVVSNMMTLGFI